MTEKKPSTAPAWTDPDDAPDLSTPEWQAKFATVQPTRGRPKTGAAKVPVKIRVDPDVLEAYRATGDGWQTRMNNALRDALPSLKRSA